MNSIALPAAVLSVLVNAHTGGAAANLTRLDKRLKGTAATGEAMGARLAKGAKFGALGVAAGVAYSVVAAAKFESAFAEVRKTVETNEKGFKRIEKGLRSLSMQIPVSANELANLAGEAGALGVKSRDIVKFTKTASMLGTTTNLSSEEAANSLARLGNIMDSKDRKAFERMGSTLVDLGNKGASTEDEIASMALRIAGAGKTLGLSEAQVLGLSASLANVGIRAEMGGSAISRVMLQMQEAIANGGGELANFADIMGVSTEQFTRQFEQDAPKAIAMFAQGLGKLNKEGEPIISTLKDVELGERRVGDTLLRIAGNTKQFTEAQGVANKAWKDNTALTKEARERYKTTAAQAQILKNKINDVFITIGQFLDPAVKKLLHTLNDLDFGIVGKEARGVIQSLKSFWKESSVTRAVVTEAFRRIKGVVIDVVKGLIAVLQGWMQIIKGVVQVISGVLTGDFGRAWKGVKNIFGGGVKATLGILRAVTAPIRGIIDGIGDAMGKGFSAAWGGIKDVFRSGANSVIGLLNDMIDIINKVPFIEIGAIGTLGGSSGRQSTGTPRNAALRRQDRQGGGFIVPGHGYGDTFETMLPAGSFILNREATAAAGFQSGGLMPVALEPRERVFMPHEVAAVGGAGVLEAMNRTVPRFQDGGLFGGLASKGASAVLGKLPDPGDFLPDWMDGSFFTKAAASWVKGQFAGREKKFGSLKGPLGGGPVDQSLAEAIAVANRHGSSGTVSNRVGAASYHNWSYDPPHKAVDLSGGNMMATARGILKAFGAGRILELFHNPLGFQVDNYRKGPMTVGDHYDHVHVAFQKGGPVAGTSSRFKGNLANRFQWEAAKVWKRAAPFFGRSSKSRMPLTLVGGVPEHSAGVTTQNRAAIISRAAAKGVLGYGDTFGRRTLLHEWAHTQQRRRGTKLWEREGGATAFTKWAGPKIFGPASADFRAPTRKYGQYARAVLNKRGRPWVKRGQFLQDGGIVGRQKGGPIQRFANGGRVVRGKVSYFDGPSSTTASGTPVSRPGLALNLNPGTDSGWNNPTTQGWMAAARAGNPVYARTTITGKTANLPIIDLGPSGFTGRAIDVTAAGVQKLGLSTSSFPTDSTGKARILGDGGATGKVKDDTETVPGVYHGARTKSLSFPSVPKSIRGIERELKRWGRDLAIYRRAARVAKTEGRPKTQRAIEANIKSLENHLRKLRSARSKLRQKVARQRFTSHLDRALGKITGQEQVIEAAQRGYEGASQYAEQLVGLEPTEPILPASATDKQREDAEKTYVQNYANYIESQERPAYEAVLGKAGIWRNSILGAQHVATNKEMAWESGIRRRRMELRAIDRYAKRVRKRLNGWRQKSKGKGKMPDRLRAEVETSRSLQARVPGIRFQERGLRDVLGEARGYFYGGAPFGIEKPVHPPKFPRAGTGSFEESLIEVQGRHWPDQHESLPSLPTKRVAGSFGGAIWDTQSAIEELGLKVKQAKAGLGAGGGGADETDSERVSLLEELLRQANQRSAVEGRLGETLKGFNATYPFMGSFAKGGVALVGERGPELAHMPSGTRVHSAGETQAMVSPSVVVNVYEGEGAEVEVNGKLVDSIVNHRNFRDGARQAVLSGSGLGRNTPPSRR